MNNLEELKYSSFSRLDSPFRTTKHDFHPTAFLKECLFYLFSSILTVHEWKINKSSCSRAELQVVVGVTLYELSRERSKTLRNNREFKKTATATATATSLNKRFNEQNNRCARAL